METTLAWELFTSPPIPTLADAPAPGDERRIWPPVSCTLIYGHHEAVLVDAPITIDHAHALCRWLVRRRRMLKALYVTHAHGDHWLGASVVTDCFPQARVLALPEVVEQMRLQAQPDALSLWHRRFPGQIPRHPQIADELHDDAIEVEGEPLKPVRLGHTDTADTTCLHVPALDLVAAGDSVYNDVHLSLRDSTVDSRQNWRRALDIIAGLGPKTVIAGHKRVGRPDSPADIDATREYLVLFERALASSTTADALYEQMIARYPDRLYPGTLWAAAVAQATIKTGELV